MVAVVSLRVAVVSFRVAMAAEFVAVAALKVETLLLMDPSSILIVAMSFVALGSSQGAFSATTFEKSIVATGSGSSPGV